VSKTVLSDLDGFTPVIDGLLAEIGLMPAFVFGKVWRYCQMEDRVCKAAQQTIADELHISRRTVQRAIELLVKNGYLEEVNTQTVNIYRDTGKAGLSIKITGTASQSRSAERQIDAVKNPTASQSHIQSAKLTQCTAPESRIKIDIKKESKKEVEYIDGDPDEIFTRMQHLCEKLIGRLSTPADIPTLDLFIREGITEADIKGALAWRASQKLRPAANIKQLEAGVLRNKAERTQAESAASAPRPAGPVSTKAMSTLEKSLAAGRAAMAEALEEERLRHVQQS